MKTTNKILLGLLILTLAVSTVTLVYIRTQLSSAIMTEGSGVKVQEERETNSFKELKVSGNIQVNLFHDQTQRLIVSGDDNLIEYLVSEVDGDVLNIYVNPLYNRNRYTGSCCIFEIDLYADLIHTIDIRASARLISNDTLFSERLNISASAGAFSELTVVANEVHVQALAGSQLELSGKASFLHLESLAGSQVRASGLETVSADIRSNAGAIVDVFVTGNLKASASTGAIVRYKGQPALRDISSSTGGQVTPN